MAEQLTDSLHATYLHAPVLRASALMDVERLHADILANLSTDPIAKAHLSDTSNPRWSTDKTGYLRLDGRMYIPRLMTYVFVSSGISMTIPYWDTSVRIAH